LCGSAGSVIRFDGLRQAPNVARKLIEPTKMRKTKDKKTYVTIPNKGDYELDSLLRIIDYLRQLTWRYKQWLPSPALIDKSGGSSQQYVGQKFDSKYFDLIEDGWTHDHCEICFATISNKPDYGGSDGYVAENSDWVCRECFALFIQPKNAHEAIQRLKTKRK